MEFLLAICVIMVLFSFIQASKSKKANVKRKEETGSKHITTLVHAYGLNFPVQAKVTTYLKDESIDFESSGATFKLSKSKLLDVSILTDVQVQSQYTSSIGGAVAGAVLLGPLGAIVGGRSKQKKSKTKRLFLIFTYIKDEQSQYISFDITDVPLNGNRFIKDFKETGGQKVSYEL